MSIKKYVAGFIILSGIAMVLPKPGSNKEIDYTTQSRIEYNGVKEVNDKQSFDEYATNTIRHFVESGSDTPSPWYDTETGEDHAFFNGYSGDSPWEPVE